jgi:hypothetical protein
LDTNDKMPHREKLPMELALEEAQEKARAASLAKELSASTTPDAAPTKDTGITTQEQPEKESQDDNKPVLGPKLFDPKQRRDNPPPDFLRSTPPSREKSTFLPKPDLSQEDSDTGYGYQNRMEPINSSNNEVMAGMARADRASSKAYSTTPRATRTGRAASSAGLDLTEEYRNKGKFRQSLQNVRKKHPYLLERPLTISDDDARNLIDKIRQVPLYKIQELSIDLNSEETKMLFHCLLLINDQQTYRAIQQLAVQRASWSLYTVGWSTLQRNFPHRWIQQTLELVFNTLVSDPSRREVRPSYMPKCIGDIVNLGKSDDGFVSDIVRNMNQAYNLSPDEGLETFISDYQILVETSLGGAIFGEFFRKADLPVLYKKADILGQSMGYMHPALAAEVISRIIASRDPIEDEKKALYKRIADVFIHSEPNHPIWPYMSADLERAYKRWYINDRIDNQTVMYPGKREFLQTYLDDIEDVAMISNDIMAIRFDQFILIDDRKRGDGVTYYDNQTVKGMLLKGLDERDLGSPNIPSRDVKDAIQSKRLTGVIRLSASQGRLQYSRQFMDLCLGHSKQREKNILKNWFK